MTSIFPLIGRGMLALGGGTLVGAYSFPDLAFGSVKKNAARELSNYDPNTQTREKELGDVFGDLFTGRGAAIDAEVQRQHVQKLNNQFSGDIRRIKRLLPNLDPEELKSLNIDAKTDRAAFNNIIDDLNERVLDRKTALGIAYSEGYGTEVAGLDTDGIYTFLRNERDKKLEEERNEAEKLRISTIERADRIRNEERTDLLRQQIANQELQTLRLSNQNAAALRSSQLDNRRLDLQEQRQNYENRRNSRKDQQLALMTIMKGLAEMGSSITA